ncbi:tub-2 [Pristionchus pacificus]|nr:tub-2 [Pristionchus pacificus]|eukprot:PDM66294.1 tub-2 [Pristionchus pacificus]
MRLAWEFDWPGSRIEPAVTSLAWTGDAESGLLASGNESGVVGITLTHFSPPHSSDSARYNFNLRGHHSAVSCVTWNRAKGKLASSDQSGVIYVWARNEERWSVELVNERGVKVKDVNWSMCGTAALICYEDNFVLIGSASGQRVWSTNYPANQNVACGVWLNAQLVVIAFANGNLQLLSNDGANLSERKLCEDDELVRIVSPPNDERMAILAKSGIVFILHSFDQVDPYIFEDVGVSTIDWTSDGKYLAAITPHGEIYILDDEARLIHRDCIHVPHGRKVTAFTWAHEGRALIVAVGGNIHVARVYPRVPSLYRLLSYKVWKLIGGDGSKVESLAIPRAEKDTIKEYDHHIIRCEIPSNSGVHNFVSSLSDSRSYCTIKWNVTSGRSFSLCIEHLGGLVPILLGRLVSRVRPRFHINIHPSLSCHSPLETPLLFSGAYSRVEDTASIPQTSSLNRHSIPRLSLWRRSTRRLRALISRRVARPIDAPLAHVSSNLSCTNFKVTASLDNTPTLIANVAYKTSVLHLQPRQMTVRLTDIDDPGEDWELLRSWAGKYCEMKEVVAAVERKGISKKRWHDELEDIDFIDGGGERGEEEELLRDHEEQNTEETSEIINDEDAKTKLDGIKEELNELQRRVDLIEKKSNRRVYTLHNKTPFWNEHNQVYQLDFGGRFDGTQSLQFGRIEGGAYTLDFRRPFSPIQAFSIALASITQRLK